MSPKSLLPLALIAAAGTALAAQATHKAAPHAATPMPHAAAQAAAHTMPAAALRDWSQIDTNGDHLVSPEEMEKYLAANPGPLKPKS